MDLRIEKNLNNSVEDYVTLNYYNESFFNGFEVSGLRLAKAPGSYKFMNKVFMNPQTYVGYPDMKAHAHVIGIGMDVKPQKLNDTENYGTYPEISN